MSKTYYCTLDELLAACMARTIKDHDVVFNGVAVALPFGGGPDWLITDLGVFTPRSDPGRCA